MESLFHEESWMLLFHFFSMDYAAFVRKDVSDVRDLSVIYSFGRNFLACVTKAASVHTLEGCPVLWITGVSFEEPSLPCTGTLGALACEKGGNKVVKFAQSTPPPPPYPFIPALFSLLNMKSRTGGMLDTSHTLQMTLVPALVTNNTYINTNQSSFHGFLLPLAPKYVAGCINCHLFFFFLKSVTRNKKVDLCNFNPESKTDYNLVCC